MSEVHLQAQNSQVEDKENQPPGVLNTSNQVDHFNQMMSHIQHSNIMQV